MQWLFVEAPCLLRSPETVAAFCACLKGSSGCLSITCRHLPEFTYMHCENIPKAEIRELESARALAHIHTGTCSLSSSFTLNHSFTNAHIRRLVHRESCFKIMRSSRTQSFVTPHVTTSLVCAGATSSATAFLQTSASPSSTSGGEEQQFYWARGGLCFWWSGCMVYVELGSEIFKPCGHDEKEW